MSPIAHEQNCGVVLKCGHGCHIKCIQQHVKCPACNIKLCADDYYNLNRRKLYDSLFLLFLMAPPLQKAALDQIEVFVQQQQQVEGMEQEEQVEGMEQEEGQPMEDDQSMEEEQVEQDEPLQQQPPQQQPSTSTSTAATQAALSDLATRLSTLVLRKGWHQDLPRMTMAGALASIIYDAVYPQRAAGLVVAGAQTDSQLAHLSGCTDIELCRVRQELNQFNVAMYLDVILTAENTLLVTTAGPQQ
ncbi:hypothetical protein PLESTB_000877800 [Pleodorina starrii]|uniref:Uncharacterized protein n=1 Tax=Pleodorina starrii TaxID=330485 RepID=A0A9W6BLT9_9CHLO|nr:hypothetical protein PLESTB_000877800 [Pleodorina starrii]